MNSNEYVKNVCEMQIWFNNYLKPQIAKIELEIDEHYKHTKKSKRNKSKSNKKKDFKDKGIGDDTITKAYLAFQEEGNKYKESQQELLNEQSLSDEIMDSENILDAFNPTVAPPSQQIGIARKNEMVELYGKKAIEIQQKETQIMSNFDNFKDKFEPMLWPVIPINL